jgi:hypothetical protein
MAAQVSRRGGWIDSLVLLLSAVVVGCSYIVIDGDGNHVEEHRSPLVGAPGSATGSSAEINLEETKDE